MPDRSPTFRPGRGKPGAKPLPPAELPPGLAPRVAAALALSDVVTQARGLDEALLSPRLNIRV